MNPKARIPAIAATSFLSLLPATQAADVTWGAGTGNWGVASNWVSSSVPTASDSAIIDNGGTARVTNTQEASSFFVGNGSGATGTVEVLAGGILSSSNQSRIASSGGTGTLLIRGGTVSVGMPDRSSLAVGSFAGGQGSVILSDAGTLNIGRALSMGPTGEFRIGEGGAPGTFNAPEVTGTGSVIFNHNATNYIFGALLGTDGGTPGMIRVIHEGSGTTTLTNILNNYSNGTELNGGVLAVAQNELLGRTDGTLTFGGGTLRTTAGFTMDRATTINSNGGTFDVQTGTLRQDAEISGAGRLTKIGTGTLNLTASNSYTGGTDVRRGTLFVNGGSINHPAAAMTVGRSNGDSASLIISNSGRVVSASGRVGDAAGSTGSVSVQSGTWANLGALIVGEFGSGSMLINGGVVSNTTGTIGRQAGSTSSVTVRSGAWSNSSTLNLGGSGNGALLINGGFVTNAAALVGQATSGVGSATVTSGSWSNNTLSLGYAGEGNLLVNGGTVGASLVRIGELSNAVGNATVTSGTLRSSGDLRIGEGGNGTLNLVGTGTVSVNAGAGTVTVAQRDGSTGTLNIGTNGAAGTLTAAVVNGGLGTAVVNFNHTNNLTFSPRLTGSLSVNKLGSGTTTLSGSNTHTGGTTIQNGTLAVNSGGSINHGSAEMRIGTVSGQTGTLAIGAGGSVTNGRTAVGSGGTGAATVSGAGAKWTLTDHFFVGGSRSGSLLIEGGGSVDVNSVLFVGNSSGFSGAVTVNGSGSSLAALQVLIGSGLGGTGVLNIEEGATLTYAGATGGVELAGRDFSSGTLNIGTGGAAGTLNARSVSAAFGLGSIATVNFNHTGATTFAPELQGILSVN